MATPAAADLAESMRGRVVERGDQDYDKARAVYNGMIDKRPAVIAYCVDAQDVAAAIRFARNAGLTIAIRCGGHSASGLGSVDDGLVIDLSAMDELTVDPAARIVQVQGGVELGQLDAATHEHGLAVPVGVISTTGVGGLATGGGSGYLTRRFGLTIDSLVAATIVLADGSIVQTDTEREPDLFWAIRGGGGNFGVVTSFSFRCHPVSNVYAGPVFYRLEDALEVIRWYREFLPAQPDEIYGFVAFMSVPPGPPFPEELHLRKVCAIAWCYAGDDDATLREARAFGKPLLDGVAAMPLPAWNSAFDALYPAGEQQYWRGEFVKELPDEAIERHMEFAEAMPSWKSLCHLYPVDGAAGRIPNDATAWAYRDAVWSQVILGVDPDPSNAGAVTEWARGYSDAVRQYTVGTGYVNFNMQETGERVRAMYGGNYERLARIKAQYDPENVFRLNQNVEPAK